MKRIFLTNYYNLCVRLVLSIIVNVLNPIENNAQEITWENYFHAERPIALTERNDFLYVGLHRNGIVKYNLKTKEKIFYNNITTNLPIGWVSSFSFDSSGTLWVTGGGLFKLKDDLWTMYRPENSDIPTDQIYSSCIDSAQNVWLSSYGYGLLKFDGIKFTSYNTTNCNIASNFIFQVLIDKKGNLWMATSKGVCMFDGKNWTTFNSSNSPIVKNQIFQIGFDSRGDLWVSTEYSSKNNLFRLSNGIWSGYNLNIIRGMGFKKNGEVWFGGNGGVIRYDGFNWTYYTVENSKLSSNYINTVYVDSSGLIWVGSSDEMSGITLRYGSVSYFNGSEFISLSLSNSSLPDNSLVSVVTDSNNQPWFTSTTTLLFKFSNTVQKVLIPNTGVNACSVIDHYGNIWIGSYLDGLKVFNGDTWQIYNKNTVPLKYNDITSLTVDNKGRVWTVNGKDLICVSAGWKVYNSTNSNMPDEWLESLSSDNYGNIWVAGSKHLIKFKGQVLTKTELPYYAKEINTMTVDSSLNVWLGTEYFGVFKYDGKSWTELNTENSLLPGNQIKVIKTAPDKSIWIGTSYNFGNGSSGLTKIKNGKWKTFTFLNSLIPFGDVQDLAFADSGKIWITLMGAGISLMREQIEPDSLNFPPVLPDKISLFQNYPNPFNSSTMIHYQLSKETKVEIKIYNVLGQEINTLLNKVQLGGKYEIPWSINELSSNVYFCVLRTDESMQTIKLIHFK